MERVIVNEGTKTNLYNLFEDLQNYGQLNFLRVIDLIIESYGVNAETDQSGTVLDSALMVTEGGGGLANYVNVAAGEALTSGLHYIRVSAPTTVSLVGLSVGFHQLYLNHAYSYSDPVDVMSGFAIGLLGGSQKNSRAHDSYSFSWDTGTTPSGVFLAWVEVINGSYEHTVVADGRSSNILRLKEAVLPNNAVNKNETGQQEVAGNIASPGFVAKTGTHSFTITAGTGTNTLSGAEATLLKTRSHIQNSDTYTDSPTFYIGGPAGTGSLAMTVSDEPRLPLNFRVTNIEPVTTSNYQQSSYVPLLAQTVQKGLISHEAAVTLRWNWDEVHIISYPATNQALIALQPGPTTSVTTNELLGYNLWHPAGLDYLITGNAASAAAPGYTYATLVTVQPYGHSTDINTLSTITAGTSDKAWVHSNVESYELVAVPVASDKEIPVERYETRIITSDTTKPVAMITKENYYLGEELHINLRSNSVGRKTGWATLGSGTFTKPSPWKSPISYTRPFLVKIPDISSIGASISATGSSAGFVINIVGWDLATDYEIVWSTYANGADFSNPQAGRIVTSSKTYSVATPTSALYYIKARPLVSGQAVADALSTNVMSGSGGSGPVIYKYGPIPVALQTYSGTLGTYSGATYTYSLSNVYSPSGSTSSVTLTDSVIGETITIDGVDYIIDDKNGNNLSIITKAGALVTSGIDGKAFTIGVSKYARELITWTGPDFDFTITEIEVDQYARPGSSYYTTPPPTVRVYPSAMESLYDTVVCDTNGATKYSVKTDIAVLNAAGNRKVTVDVWDPSGQTNSNKVGLTANITLTYIQGTLTVA